MKTVAILSDEDGVTVEDNTETNASNNTAIPSGQKDDFWTFRQGRASAVEDTRD